MDTILTGLAAILVVGVAASWAAWRFRLPAILLLLVVGFLLGPVAGWLRPDALLGAAFYPIVSLSVAVILFEGALNLRFSEIVDIRGSIVGLVTVGVLVSWALTSLLALVVLGLPTSVAVLLGAVLVVTGPTVIAPLLRHIQPRPRIRAVLRWEGIANDVVGAILAVLVLQAILAGGAGAATLAILGGLAMTIAVGVALASGGAAVLVVALKRYWIPDFLESPVALATVLTVYVLSNEFQRESGVLTVTLMGVILANQQVVKLGHIIEFKENLRVLLICALFVMLAARLEMRSLVQLGWASVLFVVLLIAFVRPLAVGLSTLRSELHWKERLFIAGLAPRGIVAAAVSSILALELTRGGVPGSERLLAETFVVIAGTVAFYSIGAKYLATWLRLSLPNPQGVLIIGAHSWARQIALALEARGFEVLLLDSDLSHVQAAASLELRVHRTELGLEGVRAGIDLTGIGKLVALTAIDEVNVLAGLQFAHALGRENIYHLAQRTGSPNTVDETMDSRRRGRVVFGRPLTFDEIDSLFRSGGEIRSQMLGDTGHYVALRGQLPPMIRLFYVHKNRLEVCSVDSRAAPAPGDVVIGLTEPKSARSPSGVTMMRRPK